MGKTLTTLLRRLPRVLLATPVLGTLVGGPSVTACARRPEPKRGVLTVSQEKQASWIRNFNPLLPPGSARWPTTAGIYEPLLVYNTLLGDYVPWLATSYAWTDGNTRLVFTLRPEVRWSDGRPFVADDVAFTFDLLRRFPAFDVHDVWSFLSDVRAVDAETLEVVFARPYVPGLFYLAHQPIVPRHVWINVADPVHFENDNPVATGPFTQVRSFQQQVFELGRNPHYWQPGKPAIDGLRFPAYPGNDQANLALVADEVDWAGNFVPDVARVFDAKDPDHHHWFPLVAPTVMLYPNTTRPPFDDERVRKAVSMAIDRDRLVRVAMYGYTHPADATGLSDAHAHWRDASAIEAGTWTRFDRAAAERLLDDAGLVRGADGTRQVRVGVEVVAGWSDWVRAARLITQNLRDVGIDAELRAFDVSAYFDRLSRGNFDLSISWSNDGPTPYVFYRSLMSPRTVVPVGETAPENWHRFADSEAETLLRAFETTTDADTQKQLVARLQAIFVRHAPALPLFLAPSWGEFNSRRFSGFPNVDRPYAKLSPIETPECLLVLTELAAR